MTYPKMTVNLDTIKNNTKSMVDLCNKRDIKVAGVTKVFLWKSQNSQGIY